MQFRSARFSVILAALIVVVGLCLVDAGAQKRKRHPVRRHAASATASPSPDAESAVGDPQIISTADQAAQPSSKRKSAGPAPSPTPTPESEQELLRRTISDLSGQVNKLSDKLTQMQEQQRSLVDVERLNRAEQRAETFRAQLRDVQAKLTEIQGQLDQLEDALRPENIERTVGLYGTTHPEVAREQRRRQLEGQQTRLKSQYDQLEQSRVRLETAVASADTEVEKLRAQMDANSQPAIDAAAASPQPTPTPTPLQY